MGLGREFQREGAAGGLCQRNGGYGRECRILEKVSEEGRSEEKEFELNVFLDRSHAVTE